MLLNCAGEYSQEFLGLQGDHTSQSWRKSTLNIHWKDWWWSWSSNTLATWYKELTCWKRPSCWERLKAEGEGGTEDEMVRYMLMNLTWLQEKWRTGKPGVLQSMGSQSWTRLSNNKPRFYLDFLSSAHIASLSIYQINRIITINLTSTYGQVCSPWHHHHSIRFHFN